MEQQQQQPTANSETKQLKESNKQKMTAKKTVAEWRSLRKNKIKLLTTHILY